MTPRGRLAQQFDDEATAAPDADEIDWFARYLPRDAGPVLDVLCGSGRLLIPLLGRDFHVHGVDPSPGAVEACEARVRAAGHATPLFRQDPAALNLPFRYGAAYVGGGAFQQLVDPALARQALERVRAHLLPPGLLLLDLDVPQAALHPPGAPLVEVRALRVADGTRITLHSETTVDAPGRHLAIRRRYERRAPGMALEREDDEHALTWYDAEGIAALLAGAGYAGVTIRPSARAGVPGTFGVTARAAP